ncbi:MAG: hypothetical protein LBB77_04110 [Treponema sp.]|nr:hypothetical protein [Treponema sp.]
MLSRVLGFALLAAGGLGLWAQEGVSPGDAVEAAGSRAPSEGEIFLGEETPGLSVAEPGPVSGFAIFRTVLLLILAAAAVYGVVFVVKSFPSPGTR